MIGTIRGYRRGIAAFAGAAAYLFLALPSPAHAVPVVMEYQFGSAMLGTFSYDDATGVVLGGPLNGFTAYRATSLDVTYGGTDGVIYTWDLGDLIGLTGFEFMPTVDPNGTWTTGLIRVATASAEAAIFVNHENAQLVLSLGLEPTAQSPQWVFPAPAFVVEPSGLILPRTYFATPTTLAVPEPVTLSLLGVGLLGFVFKRRRAA